MKIQVVRSGKSFAVRIPKGVVEEAKLREGDRLEIEVVSEGWLALRRPAKKPNLAKLAAQISVGGEVGRAVVESGPRCLSEFNQRRKAMLAFVGIRKN